VDLHDALRVRKKQLQPDERDTSLDIEREEGNGSRVEVRRMGICKTSEAQLPQTRGRTRDAALR
jgi:hypothetical protein